ncbi:MAG: DMT family transporter [Rubricella sp.]
MALFAVLVAGSFSLGGQIANLVAPQALTALRFGIAAVIMGVAAHALIGLRRDHARAPWRYLALGGLFCIYFVTMFEGLKTAPPVSTAAVFTLTPILSGLFGYWLLGQATTGRMAAALALGGIGALWVIFRADLAALLAFEIGQGEAIFFVGCIAHALYTPLVAKLNRGEPPLVFTFGTLAAGFLILTIIAAPDLIATDWAALPPIFWITLAYLSVAASAITFLLVQYAALRLKSAKVMAYTYLTPSVVILWEGVLWSDWPRAAILIGVAATILALSLLLKE